MKKKTHRRNKSPQNRSDQAPDTTHQGQVYLNGCARGICACGFKGPEREYRFEAQEDLLKHFDDENTMRGPNTRTEKAGADNRFVLFGTPTFIDG